MGVGTTNRRGQIHVVNNIVTNEITNIQGVDLDDYDDYLTQQAAQDDGLGVGDYFIYAIGSIEGNAGSFMKILELV